MEYYNLREDNTAELSRMGYKLLLRIPYIADKMPVMDVKRCNKAIRTMFSPYIYLRWLRDLNDYINKNTSSNPKRYYRISPLIKGEIANCE